MRERPRPFFGDRGASLPAQQTETIVQPTADQLATDATGAPPGRRAFDILVSAITDSNILLTPQDIADINAFLRIL